MTIKAMYRVLIACASLAFASELVYQGWKRLRSKNPQREMNEVIMFRPHGPGCGLQHSTFSRCMISPQLNRVIHHLTRARRSIDVAIYVMTSIELANVLAHLIRSGIAVRCIADGDMVHSTGSQIRRLESAGAQVRFVKSPHLMHHKFCVIDGAKGEEVLVPRVMTGSLNWTTQALNGNWENVVVTNKHDIVALYKIEFDSLWKEFRIQLEKEAAAALSS